MSKKSVEKKKIAGERYQLFGHPITSVLRWMGKNGLTVAQAREAVKSLKVGCADGTVAVQVGRGIRDEGSIPELTTAEMKKLLAFKKEEEDAEPTEKKRSRRRSGAATEEAA
jgi:phosphoribosylformimino-5-aminoimidazole carboxamide ribonucleotide (ProFAR) isomerase